MPQLHVVIKSVVSAKYRDWLRPRHEGKKLVAKPIHACNECNRVWLGFGNSGKTCKQCRRSRKSRNQKQAHERMRKARPEHVRIAALLRTREWRARNPEKAKFRYDPEVGRRNALRINFGLSVEDYDKMHATQGGLCGICGKVDATGRRLAVDHCHATGKVRGLLCGVCNTGIGKLGDTIERLEKALAYLRATADHEPIPADQRKANSST